MKEIDLQFGIVALGDEERGVKESVSVSSDISTEEAKKCALEKAGIDPAKAEGLKVFRDGKEKPMKPDECIRNGLDDGDPVIIHITSCESIKVLVTYDNKPQTLDNVSPGRKVGDVLTDVIAKYPNIDASLKGDLCLLIGERPEDKLDPDEMIGEYVPAGGRCAIKVVLGRSKAPQGCECNRGCKYAAG